MKLLLFLFFVSAYFLFSDYKLSTSMDTEVCRTAQSLVETGSFGLDQKAMVCKVGLDGKFYCVEGLLIMLSAALFYVLAKGVGFSPIVTVAVMNQVVMALGCVLIYIIGRRIGYSRKISLWLSIIFGLGTMAFVHSKFLFPEPLTILFFLSAVYCLIRFRQEGTHLWVFLCGCFTGATILLRTDAVFFIFGISLGVLYLTWHKMKDRGGPQGKQAFLRVVLYGLPLVFFFAIFAYYNYARFGNILETGYSMEYEILGGETRYPARFFAIGETLKGLLGMWLVPNRSMFFINPVLIFALFSIRRFWRQYRFESVVLGFIFCEYVYLYANRGPAGFAGSAAWGMRYMLPMVCFMIFPIGLLLEGILAHKKKGLRILFYIVLAVSIVIQLIGSSLNYQHVQQPAEQKFGGPEARLKLMMDPGWSLLRMNMLFLSVYGPTDFLLFHCFREGNVPPWVWIVLPVTVLVLLPSGYLLSRLLFSARNKTRKASRRL